MRKAKTASEAKHLLQLPNIGPAMLGDFHLLGIERPQQLADRDPYQLYDALCATTGQRHDPCVIDTFISAVRFMQGEPARPWWHYTEERKITLAANPHHG
ncbi:mitomycin resistance protein [Pseudoxanthomonas kalamensis DSM 18571]|uniref:helix-hairpin-helix domain-containing protein n=1 Tax=Pseudoxanthomonas kalamensis TaxID=289483 RepID=UPI001391A559|nr:helix-hairpin-helix domain-containing protein [Pseudoxanthomonas kalamensis]KAF1711167.1 mitomycin resistance protein [Pseudoxanthomonas kalamensis DSM 18571]